MQRAIERDAVEDHEISVVIQGPLLPRQSENAARCVESVRRVAPGAELIVSTWEGEDASELGSITVVRSPDPGGFVEREGRAFNLNRLQQSTLAGLRSATRRYCLKLRSDQALANRSLLSIARKRSGSIFEQPVTLTNLYIRDPERLSLLFHVSDTAQFGLTSDLLAFWEGPPFGEQEVLYPVGKGHRYGRIKLHPEQAVTLRWLNRNGVPVALAHTGVVDRVLLRTWAEVLLRNFEVLDWQNSGVEFPAKVLDDSYPGTLLTEERIAALSSQGFSYFHAKTAHARRDIRRYLGALRRFIWKKVRIAPGS